MLQSMLVSTLSYRLSRDLRAAVATASKSPADCTSQSCVCVEMQGPCKLSGLVRKAWQGQIRSDMVMNSQIFTRSVLAERASTSGPGSLRLHRHRLGNFWEQQRGDSLRWRCNRLTRRPGYLGTGQQQVACKCPGTHEVNDVTSIGPSCFAATASWRFDDTSLTLLDLTVANSDEKADTPSRIS